MTSLPMRSLWRPNGSTPWILTTTTNRCWDPALQETLSAIMHTGNQIVYGEQMTLAETGLEPEREPVPAPFEPVREDSSAEDGNPFAPKTGEKITLESLTSHGLEELKEEFPDTDLEMDELLKDKFPDRNDR